MPAAEIVGAVLDVEIPVEIDRDDLADHAPQSSNSLICARGRREAIVEGDIDAPAGARARRRGCAGTFRAVVAIGFSVTTSTPASSAATMCRHACRRACRRPAFRAASAASIAPRSAKIGAVDPDGLARTPQAKRIAVAESDKLDHSPQLPSSSLPQVPAPRWPVPIRATRRLPPVAMMSVPR